MLAFLGNVGASETLLLIVVAVVVFGGRLPEVARDALRVVNKVRRSFDEIRREVDLDGELHRVRRDVERRIEPPRPPAPRRDLTAKPEPEVYDDKGGKPDP